MKKTQITQETQKSGYITFAGGTAAMLVFLLMFGCSVARTPQKQNPIKETKVQEPYVPTIKFTDTKTISISENTKTLSKKDYAFIYRIFGNVKIVTDEQSNVKQDITVVSNNKDVKSDIMNADKLNQIFDKEKTQLTKQDSAFLYRIFGDYKVPSK